jgi:hypothetical protein
MDKKQKAIKALSMFEIDELPEISVTISGEFGAVGVRDYLNEAIDNAISELIEGAMSRIIAMDEQAKADVAHLIK